MAPDLASHAMSADLAIRPEDPADRAAITALVAAAFGRDEEASLVERLREAGALTISLVASLGAEAVGHVALSPVSIGGVSPGRRWLGLGPLAVRPDRQRAGIGAALMQAALAAGDRDGTELIVVLGEPGYYGRFGFAPASRHGLSLPWPVPDEAFMARLAADRIPPPGLIGYHPAFDATFKRLSRRARPGIAAGCSPPSRLRSRREGTSPAARPSRPVLPGARLPAAA